MDFIHNMKHNRGSESGIIFVFLFLVFCFCFKISKPKDTDWIFGTEYRKAATSFFNGGIDGWERDHSGSAFGGAHHGHWILLDLVSQLLCLRRKALLSLTYVGHMALFFVLFY